MKRLLLALLSAALLPAACTSASAPRPGADLALGENDASVMDGAIANPLDLSGLEVDLAGAVDYGSAGPKTYTTQLVNASIGGATVPLAIYVPDGLGTFPVVVIAPGFGQGRAGYAPYGERLASHGILAIIGDDPGLASNSTVTAARLSELVATWLPAEHLKAGGPLLGKLALDQVGLMGHSRGGQAALLSATGTLKGKVKAYFGLDPVDTQMGVGSADRARVALPTIGIPTVFLGETLDGSPAPFSFQACAPAADNYLVLYAAAPSPSLQLTAVGAAHFDFELPTGSFGAAFCNTGTAGSAAVLQMAVTLSTGFFARELLAAPVGAGLEGAGASAFIQAGRLTRTQK